MMSAWWLILIIPGCVYLGMIFQGLAAASAHAELLARLQALNAQAQALAERLERR